MLASTATLQVVGIVHVVLSCATTQISSNTLLVKEVSNNPNGYEVFVSTDADGTYDGVPFAAGNGVILTSVDHLSESAQLTKKLVFKSVPTYVSVGCASNE
jgi:hypothetical protein